MKVLWLSHLVPYPPKGGVLQRSYNLLKQASSWAEVDLVALRQRSMQSTNDALEEALDNLRAVCHFVTTFDIPTDGSGLAWTAMTVANLARRRPYDSAWLKSRALAGFIRARVDWARYDVVHVDTIGMIQYVPAVHRHRVVLNHHNVESHMMARRACRESNPFRKLYFWLDSRKLDRLERLVCPQVGSNVVVSALDAERLRSNAGPVRTDVVDNGVDTDYFVPKTPPGTGDGLVFAGGMSWYPNREAMDYFVREIWPRVKESRPTLPATIVGRHPSPAVRQAGQNHGVEVTGWVDDVRPYLDRAAVYVCPILDGGGTRLKILDALAMAKPLVATRMAVEGLELEEGKHYVRAESPGQFETQIERLLDQPELRRTLAMNGRRLVEDRYSWSAIGKKMKAAYQRS